MKIKKPFAWNVLLLSLGCFLVITSSSSGMFGEEYEDQKAAEAVKQQAAQNARARNLTASDNQDGRRIANEPSATVRGDLDNDGPMELTPEEIAEINQQLKDYEDLLKRYHQPPLSANQRAYMFSQFEAANYPSKKPQTRQLTGVSSALSQPATAACADEAAPIVPKTITSPQPQTLLPPTAAITSTAKAAAVSFPALLQTTETIEKAPAKTALSSAEIALPPPSPILTVKAAATLSPQSPQEPPLERQKNEILRNLGEQIANAERQITSHQAIQDQLQRELEQHLRKQPEEKAQILARLQKPIDDFKAANFFSSRISGTDEHYQLQGLRDKRDAAALAETPSVVTTRAALETAKNSIETLTSSIKSLKQEHATVLRELEVSKRDRLTREVAEAAAAARAEALAWEKIGSIAVVKRSSLGSTSSEGNDSQPSTPPGKQRSSSDGSSSGNESNQSTPEKQPLLTATFTTATMAEVEHLQSEIARTHDFIGKARELVKEAMGYYCAHDKRIETYNRYFDLAEKRSRLKQSLANLMRHTPEPVFRKPENVAELVSQYERALTDEEHIKSSNHHYNLCLSYLRNLYKAHAIYNMEQYRQHPTICKIEQSLIKDYQQIYQKIAKKLLEAELVLLAPEEQPPVYEALTNCIWQNMPEFSIWQRKAAMDYAREEAEASGSYTRSSGSSSGSSYRGDYGATQRYLNSRQQFMNQQQQGFNNWLANSQISFNNNQMRINSNNYSYK